MAASSSGIVEQGISSIQGFGLPVTKDNLIEIIYDGNGVVSSAMKSNDRYSTILKSFFGMIKGCFLKNRNEDKVPSRDATIDTPLYLRDMHTWSSLSEKERSHISAVVGADNPASEIGNGQRINSIELGSLCVGDIIQLQIKFRSYTYTIKKINQNELMIWIRGPAVSHAIRISLSFFQYFQTGGVGEFNPVASKEIFLKQDTRIVLPYFHHPEVKVNKDAWLDSITYLEIFYNSNGFVSSSLTSKPGGIDFRSLPIVTQAMTNLSANISSSAISKLRSVNLDIEWQKIKQMAGAGIRASSQRIKEYVQAACLKESIVQLKDKIILYISDILRLEEELCIETDCVLRDILVVLESVREVGKLKAIFVGR